MLFNKRMMPSLKKRKQQKTEKKLLEKETQGKKA